MSDKVGATLIRADIDEEPDLALEYDVRSVPTLISFKGGEQLGYIRSRTALALINEINSL